MYKLYAWTIILYTVWVIHTPSFMVVQLMDRLLRCFQQSLPNLVVYVQTCRLDHYTSCSVGNVHNKFQGCTIDVQVATGFLTISTFPCYRCTNLSLGHYTLYSVGNAHAKFQGCTADVQAATGFLTISTLYCCRCANLLLGPWHFMRCTEWRQQVSAL